MSMFGGSGLPGGAHDDVLAAMPTDDVSKSNLVEELKVKHNPSYDHTFHAYFMHTGASPRHVSADQAAYCDLDASCMIFTRDTLPCWRHNAS